jgi:prepilin-type N-terminal cleavage/methylation domain-containing protein
MTLNYNLSKRKKSAFTLLELSIVLIISSIIITGSIGLSGTAIKNAKIDTTNNRLEKIEQALLAYVRINKRLPCPASLYDIETDSTYASQKGVAGVCDLDNIDGIFTSITTNADALVYGALPAKTLGLSIEYAKDGFKNKFSYVVPKGLTEIYGINPGFEGLDMTVSSNSPITVNETLSGSPGTSISSKVAYVIISHGKNGYGAFQDDSGTTQNPVSSDLDEQNNYPISAEGTANFDDIFISNSGSDYFDDVVKYSTRELIQQLSGGFETTACPSEYSSYNDQYKGIISFPTAYYGQLSQGSIICTTSSAPAPITTNYPARRCGKNGVWETPVEYPCNS